MSHSRAQYVIALPADRLRGCYYPGEMIKGELYITSPSPPDLAGLQVKLMGQAKVSLPTTNRQTPSDRTETYIETSKSVQSLEKLEAGNTVPQNTSVFGFGFFLRPGLPPSFWSPLEDFGYSSYWLELNRVDGGRKTTLVKVNIMVGPYLSLEAVPFSKDPVTRERHGTSHWFCCGADRDITVKIWLDRAGVCLGETIPFNALIINNSKSPITSSYITLKRYWTLHYSFQPFNMQEKVATFRKVTCGPIPPGGTMTWGVDNPQVVLPPMLVPTGPPGCSLIDVSYELSFTVVPAGMARRMKLLLPILVGAALPETVRQQVEENTATHLDAVARATVMQQLAAATSAERPAA